MEKIRPKIYITVGLVLIIFATSIYLLMTESPDEVGINQINVVESKYFTKDGMPCLMMRINDRESSHYGTTCDWRRWQYWEYVITTTITPMPTPTPTSIYYYTTPPEEMYDRQ